MRDILDHVLGGGELSEAQAIALFDADVPSLMSAADTLRREQAGDLVTYVVNRNINFTNVCTKTCRFCAFSRDYRSEEGYFLDQDEILRRAEEAWSLGATEVCVQAGLLPRLDGRFYIDLTRALKKRLPDLHLHAFSPEEVKHGARKLGWRFKDYLAALKDAGLGSLPGTSAEILIDEVRREISPGRITTAEWIEVITSAHELGLPTTSTMMYGHVETIEQRVKHLGTLRSIQRTTGGFTEFVPLSFVHSEAPLFKDGLKSGRAPTGPSGDDVIRMHAIARLFLGRDIKNLQVSWVKEGLPMAQHLLAAGVNDLGGTLMNESISTAAGASHGQSMTPSALRSAIRAAGRTPAERGTKYQIRRVFEGEQTRDLLDDADPARFGSYAALTRDARYRYKLPMVG
jgi:FO synthase subunit 2